VGNKKKLKIIVTAGPTQEPIDIVRFITNSSSGMMGYLLAEAAIEKEHEVILISGPSSLAVPAGVEVIQIRTAGQMYETVKKYFYDCDCLIMAAAVCDFKPKDPLTKSKFKKEEGVPVIDLERTPDILIRLNRIRQNQLMVGFALEVSELEKKAREKLIKKKLDLIIGNKITSTTSPFGSKNIDALIMNKKGKVDCYNNLSKKELACIIIEMVEKIN